MSQGAGLALVPSEAREAEEEEGARGGGSRHGWSAERDGDEGGEAGEANASDTELRNT